MRGYPEIFASVARGKRSIEIDLRTDAGRARAFELAADADVVCEAWRPGVADRLGVGYDAVRARRPDTIYCSLSGYGAAGPLRDLPGHDVNFQALAGALAPRDGQSRPCRACRSPTSRAGRCARCSCARPGRTGSSTGEGERIDVAMTDVVAWWVGTTSGVVHADATGRTAGSPGYGVFRTRDDRWLALGVLAESAPVGRDRGRARARRPRRSRLRRAARRDRRDQRRASQPSSLALDLDDALARLEARGAPVSPVLTPEEATAHPQLRARDIHVATEAGVVVGLPARLGNAAPRWRRISPRSARTRRASRPAEAPVLVRCCR